MTEQRQPSTIETSDRPALQVTLPVDDTPQKAWLTLAGAGAAGAFLLYQMAIRVADGGDGATVLRLAALLLVLALWVLPALSVLTAHRRTRAALIRLDAATLSPTAVRAKRALLVKRRAVWEGRVRTVGYTWVALTMVAIYLLALPMAAATVGGLVVAVLLATFGAALYMRDQRQLTTLAVLQAMSEHAGDTAGVGVQDSTPNTTGTSAASPAERAERTPITTRMETVLLWLAGLPAIAIIAISVGTQVPNGEAWLLELSLFGVLVTTMAPCFILLGQVGTAVLAGGGLPWFSSGRSSVDHGGSRERLTIIDTAMIGVILVFVGTALAPMLLQSRPAGPAWDTVAVSLAYVTIVTAVLIVLYCSGLLTQWLRMQWRAVSDDVTAAERPTQTVAAEQER